MPRQEIIQNDVGAKIVQGESIRFVKLIYFRDTIKKLSLNTLDMDKKDSPHSYCLGANRINGACCKAAETVNSPGDYPSPGEFPVSAALQQAF